MTIAGDWSTLTKLANHLFIQGGLKMTQFVCQKVVKYSPNLLIFGIRRAKTIELCKVHLFFTSPNFCQRTIL